MDDISGEFCAVEEKEDIPWASTFPDSTVITLPQLWEAILDPEVKNKGRLISVLVEWGSSQGAFGNNCPQPVRDKIKGMML